MTTKHDAELLDASGQLISKGQAILEDYSRGTFAPLDGAYESNPPSNVATLFLTLLDKKIQVESVFPCSSGEAHWHMKLKPLYG